MDNDLLNLFHLKYFCDAVRLGSITASARANCVTQSAISQGIAKLEQSLGVELVAHHPNTFKLTPDGEGVFRGAIELLQKLAEFKTSALEEKEERLGDLEFASTYSFAIAVLSPYLKRFRSDYPDVKIYCEFGKNREIQQMVKAGRIDFGILPDEGDLDGFETRDLYRGEFKLYASRKSPLTKKSPPGLILAPSTRRETTLAKEVMKKAYLERFGQEAKVIMEVGNWEMIVNLVAEGVGIGYFPDFFGKMRERELKECAVKAQFPSYEMKAISLRGMKLRRSSERFLCYFS